MNQHAFVALLALLGGLSCGGLGPEHGEPGGLPDRPGSVAHAGELAAELKLATWNLEWLNRKDGTGPVKRSEPDYARLRHYAERLGADVIAFQEVDGSEAAARVFDPRLYQLHVSAQNDPQRTGFAVRRGVPMRIHPDDQALDVGQVRVGADISVDYAGGTLRLLSVHLKSSCFDEPLGTGSRDCQKLAAQLPVLEAWIDARGREHVPAIVLGDFNRRLFKTESDEFWRELDDADPPESNLWSPTAGQRALCWHGAYRDFIDHLVFNKPASALVLPNSFEQDVYEASDAAYKGVLSDHCPLAITLAPSSRVLKARVKWPVDAGLKLTPATNATAGLQGLIKGNIKSGRKLFHTPGCPGYEATRIDESKGERWFKSEREALAAGWSKSPNCK